MPRALLRPRQGCGLPWDRPDVNYKPHFAANYLAFYGGRPGGARRRAKEGVDVNSMDGGGGRQAGTPWVALSVCT